jgi:hypothetical protein
MHDQNYWWLCCVALIGIVTLLLMALRIHGRRLYVPMYIAEDLPMVAPHILMTHKSLSFISDEALERMHEHASGLHVFFFDNAGCQAFLNTHYGPMYVQKWRELNKSTPAFAADFWRYCALLRMGGVYIDSDMEPLSGLRLADLVDFNSSMAMTCIAKNRHDIFQSFLAAPAGWSPLKTMIDWMMASKGHKSNIHQLGLVLRDRLDVTLMLEQWLPDRTEPRDRYGYRGMYVADKTGKKWYRSRYTSYPWKQRVGEIPVPSWMTINPAISPLLA